MSEALDHVRQVCAEFDARNPNWRAVAEEDKARAYEQRKREIDVERERKAREAVEKQQVVATSWYEAVDKRIHEHLQNWLWKAIDEHITQWWNDNAIDERITQSWDIKCEPFKDAVGGALGTIRERLRDEFKHALGETVDAFGAEIAALEQRLASNNQAALVSTLAHERDEYKRAIEEQQRAFETKLA